MKAWYTDTDHIISIHTPTKGATEQAAALKNYFGISIHTPTKGATIIENDVEAAIEISIHTPTKGATYAVKWYR